MTGGTLLVLAVVQLVLTAIPLVGASLVAVRLGVREPAILLGIAIAASGVAAMLIFWAYYLDTWLGAPCAYAVVAAGAIGTAWAWPVARREPELLRRLAVPLGLWALGSLFLIFFGFLHGGTEAALETGATRFSTNPSQLPSDNFIPYFFGDWLYGGHPGSPPIFPPEWAFSDRPPLQIGYLLSQRPFGWDMTTLHAGLIGVLIQQLWIVALWALLEAARIGRSLKGLVIVAALLSDVAIVNGFFTWPKLLAAAFVLAALALVALPRDEGPRRQPLLAILLGVLFGLGYMAHGSAAFAIVAVLLVLLWRRGLPSWRWVAAGVAALLIVVLPWSAYQHWGDPPGNRVVKWALAGVTKIDGRGVLEEVRHAYSERGLGGSLELKLQNFLTIAGGGPGSSERTTEWIHFSSAFVDSAHAIRDIGEGRFADAVSEVRESRFSHLLWSLGLLLLGLPVIAVAWLRGVRPRGGAWDLARLCGVTFMVGVVIWALISFGNLPSRAIISQGSMVFPLIGMVSIVAGLWAVARRWAWWLVGLNALTVLVLYAPSLIPRPGTSFSGFNAIIAALCLLGFVALGFGWAPAAVRDWWRGEAAAHLEGD